MANFLEAIGRGHPVKAFGEGYKAMTDVMMGPERERERKEERALRIGGLEQQQALTKTQLESEGIELQKKKEQREFESRGWDPDIDPVFQKWLPDDQQKAKEQLSKMIPPNPQTGKWTQKDRARAMEMMKSDAGMLTTMTQFNVNAIKSNIQKVSQQLAKAEETGKTSDIPKLRVQLKTLTDQHDIELGKFDKINLAFEIKDLLGQIDESKMPENVKASIQALGKANDLEGIREVLRDYVKQSIKPLEGAYKIGARQTIQRGTQKVTQEVTGFDAAGRPVWGDVKGAIGPAFKPEKPGPSEEEGTEYQRKYNRGKDMIDKSFFKLDQFGNIIEMIEGRDRPQYIKTMNEYKKNLKTMDEVTAATKALDIGKGELSTKYGLRPDRTPKGKGFLGALKRPDGKVSTEISMGVNFNGKETLIPLLVPTLTKDEIDYLLRMKKGEKPTKEIVDKAVKHAKERMSQGLSPFAGDSLGIR